MFTIYVIENLITGTKYVGQIRNSIKKRFQEHGYSTPRNKSLISKSMKKNGKENFKIDVLEICSYFESADAREIYWIKELNTLVPNGYNLDKGGNGKSGLTDETRLKMSIAQKNRVPHRPNTPKMRENKSITGTSRPPTNAIGFKGVSVNKRFNGYTSKFEFKNDCICGGSFKCPIQAAIATDIISHIKRPGVGYFNFPEKSFDILLEELIESPSREFQMLVNEKIGKTKYKIRPENKKSQICSLVDGRKLRGITKENSKYRASIQINGKIVRTCVFQLADDACTLFDILVIISNGNLDNLNFPEKTLDRSIASMIELIPEKILKLIEEYKSNVCS